MDYNMTPASSINATFPDFGEFLKKFDTTSRAYKCEEIGQTGTLNFGGFLDTEEWIGNLKGYTLYQTVDYMRTDTIISALENGFFYPIEQATPSYFYEDKAALKDPHYKSILDFCQRDFNRINKQHYLHNGALHIPYGFSPFEQVYEEQADKYLHLARLSPRLPKTAFKWLTDGHGQLKVFIQLVYTPNADGSNGSWEYKPIDAEKLLIITGRKEGGNFAGRSEYRPYYREWLVKDKTMKQLVIAIQRVGGGIPVGIVNKDTPETSGDTTDGTTTENLSTLRQLENALKRLQSSESSYLAGKGLDKLDLLSLPAGSIDGLLNVIKYCDESIVKNGMQMLFNLGGSTGSGSRALGDSFEDRYYVGLEGKLQTMASAWDEQVTKRLIDYNFGEQEIYPKQKLNLKKDMGAILNIFSELKKSGLVQGNMDFENFCNDYYGMPATTKENMLVAVKPSLPGQPTDTAMSATCTHDHKAVELSAKGKPLEPIYRAMKDGLDSIRKRCADDLRKIIEPEMIRIAGLLAGGAKIYAPECQPSWGNKVADTFRKYYKQILDQGRSDVQKELISKNIKLSETILLADKKKTNNRLNYEVRVNRQADLNSEIIGNNAKSAIAGYWGTALEHEGETAAWLKDYMITKVISEVGERYLKAADEITAMYGNAREISAEEFKSSITSKIRTGVFDNNICDHCADEDGHTYYRAEDGEYYDETGAAAPDLPDINCAGAEYRTPNPCRCMFLYGTGE